MGLTLDKPRRFSPSRVDPGQIGHLPMGAEPSVCIQEG